jgi:uncharacterized protein
MMTKTAATYSGAHLELIGASEAAVRAIPPLWPLAASVAVNPFLGQTSEKLSHVAAMMGRIAGQSVTMPRSWYRARIEARQITEADLAAAVDQSSHARFPDVQALRTALAAEEPARAPLPTVAELAADASGIDWPGLLADRIGTWAASHFDAGQALWQTNHAKGAFESWRIFASRDLTPEIMGLSGFARLVADTPDQARNAVETSADVLGLKGQPVGSYFHQLLLGLKGWSQLARYRLWQAELGGSTDATTSDLLAIRLIWEQALYVQYKDKIGAKWGEVLASHAAPVEPDMNDHLQDILQRAAEHASQRQLAATLAQPGAALPPGARPKMQAAFCIDVRSEVFRRALESLDPQIETSGFAGFFGLTASHKGFASDQAELRLPVLLNPGLHSVSGGKTEAGADQDRRFKARSKRAWGRFKLAAVSSFAFVEAMGPVYIAKLVQDALAQAGTAKAPDPMPRLDPLPDLDTRITMAGNILRAMSLTQGFAPTVLLVGHGAGVVNNPHASALQCGACGGYSGEVNARLLAGLLNTPEVRKGLAKNGLNIPADTVFLGALHNTTTDAVTVFADDHPDKTQKQSLAQIKGWLASAGHLARTERALRLPRAVTADAIQTRATDWAELRPEWALAGCSAFIAAPRKRTRGKSLQGRAFLHDYAWQEDEGFGILELIMTAPVVVASWISLQYYGSVVAPDLFGGGNKLLHNVTGGVGVVEGNGGLLRAGLPWQSVHDGEGLAHDPLRLSVCIEAPTEAMSDILSRHPGVRALFDNGWLHLFALDDNGQITARYKGDLEWTPANLIAPQPQSQAA